MLSPSQDEEEEGESVVKELGVRGRVTAGTCSGSRLLEKRLRIDEDFIKCC